MSVFELFPHGFVATPAMNARKYDRERTSNYNHVSLPRESVTATNVKHISQMAAFRF